ncbi:helix-turn-helix transcriptional regulator [Carbonactinospora thermoautotrophica]|nr:helix-turn-helix transcriptional regulator [Carbonactinospora thermoautotrophica]
MVLRQRLLDRVSKGVCEPLMVVSGPAGSGKTQLAASWVSAGQAPGPVVWITLEDGDGKPGVFWSYVVEGLRRGGLSLSPTVDRPAQATIDRSFLVRLAADLATQPAPAVLVLDSVDVLTDQQLADDLDFVLRHADHHLRLVLVGRRDPPLPLYHYRLIGRLAEIRHDDLAFTTAESAELLAGHGVELPQQALASLVERTEGWAVGLRLFAMALQGHGNAEDLVATIAGDEANIAEYFLREVLKAQPVDVRDFLLKTSILDTVTPELAQVLTGRSDARRTLAALARANAFVQPVAGRSTAYHYHRLFAELLRAQLVFDEPEEVPDLHRRAAGWFAAEGRLVDAVRHAVTARDWGYAASLLIEDLAVGQLLLGEKAAPLGQPFRDMPDDVDAPEPALVTAALALAGSDTDRCAKHLARAEKLMDTGTPEQSGALQLAAAVLAVIVACRYGDVARAVSLADAAEALLAQAPPERVAAHPELRALVLSSKGAIQNWAGAVEDATATLREGAKVSSVPGCERPRLDCLGQLALLEAYHGRLRHAAVVAAQVRELANQCGLAPQHRPAAAEAALAWVAVERYDVETAWRHVRTAEATIGIRDDPLSAAALALVRSRLLRARGDLRTALHVLREARMPRGGRVLSPWLEREIAVSQARLLVAMGRPDEALATIDAFEDHASPEVAVVLAAALLARGDTDRGREIIATVVEATDVVAPLLVDAWLVLSAEAAKRGEGGHARAALRQALRLATPESYRRAFHEAGPRLRQLLRDNEELAACYRSLGTSPDAAYHRPSGDARPHVGMPVVVDSLSERELEVLRYVAAMLSTEEIAAVMYVSVNTIKTHVRSILRKLSASRRNEAVRRARELGLI